MSVVSGWRPRAAATLTTAGLVLALVAAAPTAAQAALDPYGVGVEITSADTTSTSTPTITGNYNLYRVNLVDPYVQVAVLDGSGNGCGASLFGAAGPFSCTLSSPLAEGVYEIAVTVFNSDGEFPSPVATASQTLTYTVPVDVDPSIANVALPTITGTAKVGRVLSATSGAWDVEAPALAYQWLRNGEVILSATASTYRVTAADAGASLTVAVTASTSGYVATVATSAATVVAKLNSVLVATPAQLLHRSGQSFTVKAFVWGDAGVQPSGEVAIFDGTRQIAVGAVDSTGHVVVAVPGLSHGIHAISAKYLGNEQLQGDCSIALLVLVR